MTQGGIPFAEFESVVAKLRNAFLCIPEGRGLMSPCNKVLRLRPPVVYLHRNTTLWSVLGDARTLLREATREPTLCSELVMGYPQFGD